ncbi:DUF2510 domain-containing protein [Nocardioides sp. DS6]|uniref:DUF2510 domain-containing protein n=1 Tax=Nocardioides eburneus TaxID=3231482 RepID=A0ABV3STU5_9ACTN
MSSPGWYPDPAGDPDLLRYWDGTGWSGQTRPADKRPEEPSAWPELEQPPTQAWAPVGERRGRRTGLVAALAVAAVLVAGGGVGAAVALSRHDTADPSPAVTSLAPTSPATGGSTTVLPIVNDCPDGDTFEKQKHPKDGRVHGGGLSFPRQPGAEAHDEGFPWADDTHGETIALKGTWVRFYVVGRLPAWSGYSSLQRTAESMLSCIARDKDMYPRATRFTPAFSRATTVDGHDAWEARGSVYVDGAPYPGGTVHVVAVDTGKQGYSIFMGDAPIGVKSDLAALDAVVKELKVD